MTWGRQFSRMEFREMVGALVLSVAMVVAVVLTYMMFFL